MSTLLCLPFLRMFFAHLTALFASPLLLRWCDEDDLWSKRQFVAKVANSFEVNCLVLSMIKQRGESKCANIILSFRMVSAVVRVRSLSISKNPLGESTVTM